MKQRRAHTVSLPTQAVELLEKVRGFTGHREHVFPNRDRRGSYMTDATMRQALKYLGWSGKYSPHATRTTGSTLLNEMGYNAGWIEFQLAHADRDAVRGTYNHARYLKPRAMMMQAWADYLDSLKADERLVDGQSKRLAI
jgi:integrase